MENNILSDELYTYIIDSIYRILRLDESSDVCELLDIYINKAAQEILNLTNRKIFPEGLKYLLIDMACDMYRLLDISNPNSEVNKQIQSMSETGRSVTFGAPSNITTQFNLLLQKQLENNKLQINRYRLLYKIVGGENE